MPSRRKRANPLRRRALALVTSVAMMTALLGVQAPTPASAAATVLFDNTFTNNTVNGTGTVTKPTSPSGTNLACLTASGNTATGPLLSCSGTTDAAGSGVLRFTAAAGSQIGGILGATTFPTTTGLDVNFKSYQWGGGGADGLSFLLAAVDPANPGPPAAIGAGGGALGYSAAGTAGVVAGYLGVGLDTYGNFSAPGSQGSGCSAVTNINAQVPGAVVVRGPGNNTTGYCGLSTTYDGTAGSKATLESTTRAASVVPVEVLVNPTAAALTSATGTVVAAGTYKVVVTPIGQPSRTLTGTLPTVPSTLYPSTTWTNANGIPKQLAFGFAASTGGITDNHEISNVQVASLTAATPGPATPASPTVSAVGLNSATVSWVAPANNGSAITKYVLTPYLNGAAQTALNFDPAATTRTINGLTAGGSYTFTLAAVNANGTSAASPPSNAGVPYSAATAPTVTTVKAGDSSATLTWSAPSGTSPITGYVVTPYIGSTAQPTQSFAGTGTTQTVTGLTPGTAYTFTVAATNATGTNTLYRVNAAGTAVAATDGGPAWSDDTAATSTLHNSGSTASGAAASAIGFDSTIPTGTPTALFNNERYDTGTKGDGGEMSWFFPVTSGATAKVRLYFANQYSGTSTVGTRIFDVALEGNTVLDHLDIICAAGGTLTATMREFTVTSDGTINIDFIHEQPDNPLINAIEIIKTGLPSTGPPSAASASVTPNASPTLNFPAPPAGQVGVAYSNQLAVTGGTSPFTWSVSAGTLPPGLTLSTSGLLSGTPTTVGSSTFTVKVVDANNQSATQSVTLVISGKPGVPAAPTATPGITSATVAWVAPANNGSPLTKYVVTPYLGGTAQAAVTYDAAATIRTITGLTAGGSYTFTVAAVNAYGTSAASPASAAVVPYSAPSAPTVPTVSAGDSSVTLNWSAPSSNGGSSITGYVVTPYLGAVAQTATTLTGTATTGTVTGLTPGQPYTFTVAAQGWLGTNVLYRVNAGGAAVAAGDGGLAWSDDSAADNPLRNSTGTASVTSTGAAVAFDSTIPSGTPTALFNNERYDLGAKGDGAEMSWFFPVNSGATVKVRLYFANQCSCTSSVGGRQFDVALEGSTVLDHFDPVAASGGDKTATMREFSVTSDGTVNIDFIHEQPDAPMINAIEIIQTGLPSTGPTSAASASATPNTSPTLNFPAPPAGQVGVAYSNQLTVTGGTSPFTWSVSAGTLPAGLTLNSSGLLSGTLTTVGSSTFTVRVVDGSGQSATQSVTLVVTDKPAAPAAPTATAGITSATVSWVAPANNGSAITGYVVTPYKAGVAQTPVSYDASATSRTLSGLTAGSSYTFTVAATNATGTSAPSAQSTAVTPYALPGAPTISAATAGDSAATLTWTTPSSNGSAITGYVVNPYIGATAQPTQTFSAATTQTVTGLTAGTAYTFTVAAVNQAGTGPASAASAPVTPNNSPSLNFPAPPSGEVGVAYSNQLTVTGGTSPFTWSVSAGTLPPGLTLNASTGLLSGTPTAAGSSTFTVRVVDASTQSATQSVTLVIAAAPALSFAPAAGEVNVAYSQQPVRTGGTAPFAWAVTAGSLPAGLSINASTGLVSGSPTAAGSFSVTITVTDSFNQVATTTATIVIAALPTLTFPAPASGQVGVAYSTSFTAAGGTAPLTWSIPAGALPAGLTLTAGTGVLSGTPTTVGSYSFTVAVTDANNKTATKAVTLVIAAGPLVIVKTANVSSAVVGSTVQYTVTVTNTGSTAFSGVALSDPLTGVLDDAVYNSNATASTGTVSYASSTVSWTGNLAANGSVTITYSVTVNNPDVGNMVLANTVSSSTLGTNCAAGSVDARCTATVTVAGLTIVKSADVSSTTPGSTVRYSISVTNSGQTAYAPATLTDNLAGVLDDATYNSDATSTSGSVAVSNGSLTWTGNLAVGASTTITYSVTVADPDTGNRSLTGTIVSSTAGSTCPGSNPAASCSTTVTVLVPALVITNSSNVSTTTPGSTVPYTVTLSNTGQTAYTATTVNVALAAALDDATYSGNATASAGNVSYNAGAKTLTWTGDLAIGAVVTITASVTVNNPDAGDKTLTTVASSSAPGSTCPAGSSNSACTSTVQVLIPALTITKSADVSSTTPGSTVHYTVSVTNSGQTDYTGAAFSDSLAGVLDDATYRNDAAATSGTVSVSASTVGWTGNLAIGATATITYSVLVNQPDTGNKSLTGTVTSTTPGNACPNGGTDPRCTSSVTVLIPALTVTSAVDASTTTPGSVVNYTFSLSNTGQIAYSGATVVVDLTGVLDDATYNNDASATTGSLVINGNGTATWTISLAAGASASVTLSATVNSPPAGNKTLSTTVTSDVPGSTCPTGSANTACKTTVTVLIPGLTITKTANASAVTPGDAVGYTITVLNNGQSSYSAASFSDSLSMVLPDATYGGGATATSGTMSYSASTLSWTGALAPGTSATITYSVTVRDPDPGNKRMVNTVVSSAAGNNCASGSADARCTAAVNVLVPRLTIIKTANVSTAAPGAVVGYTITATNSGQTAYTGATFSDSLSGVLDDATYNSDAAAGTGTATYTNSTLSWTGDLAVGAAVTLTYSVTVHAADGGNNQLANTVTSTTRGNNCPSGGTDARCTASVPVARLVLSTSFQEATTTPGSVLHLSSTFTNTGQVPYTGISVTNPRSDVTDDAGDNGDQTVSTGTLTFGSTTTTWTGDIPVGAVVTITRTLTVQNPDTGNQRVTATLTSTAPGNNCQSGTTDARCTFLATVLTPALTISRTANTTATVPGGSVTYTTTIHNTGQTVYTAAVVTDHLAGALDDATYDANAVATSGALSFSSPSLTWTGDVAVGATVTITYSMTVKKPDPADKTMVSSVSSTDVGSTCPPSSGDAVCHNTVLILTPALTIAKTANVASATLGSTVTYTVKVTNSGQTAYSAASFSDPLAGVLDDATYNQAATTATGGTVGYANSVLSWTGALNPGTSATIVYTVTINNPSTGDRSMVNTVSSANDGNNCATGSADNRCTATVVVTNAATLTFTKVADVPSTVAGGVVNYTVTAVNSSASTVASVNFTDSLGGILDDATYNADAAASSGTVTYTNPNLTWTGDIPAGATVTVTYSVTVHKPVTGNQILAGTVTSTSFPGSDNCLAGTTDPRCTSTVPVAGLVIEQHYTETSATPGQLLHLSATFINTGAMPYTGIRISSPSADTVDDGIPSGDQTASSGDLVLSPTAIIWTGSIPVGGVVTVMGTLTVKNPDTGNKVITGTLTSTAPGNNCPAAGTDPGCTALINVLVPGLTISKSASTMTAVPGASVGYTVSIQNSGQTAYSAASVTDSLTGVLDDATYNTDAVTTSGTLSYNSPTLTWSGSLAVGTTVTITYSVTVKNPDPGDQTMASSISSAAVGSSCPPGDGNGACGNTVTILNQALTLSSTTNSSTSIPGAVVTYTVTATNSGQTDYSAATFSAPLAGVLDDATYGSSSADIGSVTLAGQTLSWTGALAMGATATITYTVTVKNPDTGNHRLDQTLTSTTEGSSCPAGGNDARCTTSVLIASLHIMTAADVATTKPTSVVHYTDTFTNTGQVPYVDITIFVDVRGAGDDATYNGDAAATSGSVSVVPGSPMVSWTGDLPVGATVVFTSSVTVNNPDLGDHYLNGLLTTTAAGSNCPSGSTDPACANSVRVLIPALSITQAVSTSSTTPGSAVGYTITIANTGQTPYTAAVVSDSLQNLSTDATYQNDATATSGTVSFADPP